LDLKTSRREKRRGERKDTITPSMPQEGKKKKKVAFSTGGEKDDVPVSRCS